ncbi:hypothetical protein GGF38_001721 [Coemansia sp. RSA 25]|nr:hypothetical protein GGF38_001721 [Coemansia sp. RSA 25]
MSKSLQRRSQVTVRKSDIRVVTSSKPAAEARRSFRAAQDTGSGDENDIVYQRLATWLGVVQNYQEYFQSMVAAELDLATVYARIGDILRVPVQASALLLPASGEGAQAVARRLKGFQQLMVEGHCAISQAAKQGALGTLDLLHSEAKALLDAYAAALSPVYGELAQCKASIERRARLLEAAIAAAGADKEVAKDPFLLNLEVEALLRKRAALENELFRAAREQQARVEAFEPRLVAGLASAVGGFVGAVSAQHRQLRLRAKRDVRAIARVDGAGEWRHFSAAHGAVLAAPQAARGAAQAGDYAYGGRGSAWARVLRQGVVAVRAQGPLFRSTWQSRYGVVTPRGYFHVFRSQGDVVRGVPETSVFLPRAHVALVRAGTLQISSGGALGRSRIVIQDGAASLAHWRLLMESASRRSSTPEGAGLATPPDSGAEESPPRSLSPPRNMSPSCNMSPRHHLRPFSADASMLAQTPTKLIYLQPLGATPLGRAPPALLSPARPCSVDAWPCSIDARLCSIDAYSPAFSDSRSASRAGSCAPPGSSSSSGAPPQPESLFAPSASQDSESAPLSSLPRLRARAPPLSAQEAYPRADERCQRADIWHSADIWRSADAWHPADIWHSDVLSMPDPARRAAAAAGSRPRPRSMIHEPSYAHGALDPANPYLGDFFASRPARASAAPAAPVLQGRLGHPRAVSQPAALGPASPTLASYLSVGPCASTPRSSRDSIPEHAFECELPAPAT